MKTDILNTLIQQRKMNYVPESMKIVESINNYEIMIIIKETAILGCFIEIFFPLMSYSVSKH